MKYQKYIWLAMILIIGLAVWQFHKPTPASSQPKPPATTSATTGFTNPVSVAVPTANQKTSNASPSIATSAEMTDIENRYREGQIDKGQAIQETLMEENKKSLDLYGRVVDQYGQPVVGAKVEGSILLNVSFVRSGGETHFTESDPEGRFSFLGVHGVGMGIRPQKEGYIYNLKMPSQRPDNYQPAPNNPVVFTMWKVRGAESLISSSFGSKIPFDGTPVMFDISTQKQNPEGDLQLTLSRFPLQIPPGLIHPYQWQVRIGMLHGGLVPENDAYPYWAPDNGYEPSFEFNMSSNNVPWDSKLIQSFYIKSSHGQYGRMQVTIYTDLAPARIKFDFLLNPSGSQNLEPSPTK